MSYTEEELRKMSMEKLEKIGEKLELELEIIQLKKKKVLLEEEIQEVDKK